MAELEFRGLRKVFPGGAVAIDDLNLVIPDGEFLVLVGPSGSGKTTALRMLAGLEEVDAGTIYIADRDVTDLPPKQRAGATRWLRNIAYAVDSWRSGPLPFEIPGFPATRRN